MSTSDGSEVDSRAETSGTDAEPSAAAALGVFGRFLTVWVHPAPPLAAAVHPRRRRGRVPRWRRRDVGPWFSPATRGMLSRSLVQRIVKMPAETLDHFDHPTRFTGEHTRRDLADSGIVCPPLSTYLPTLLDLVRRHPEIDAEQGHR